ncbi:MAG: Z1 domain-containing protein [Nannocystales bacterium]
MKELDKAGANATPEERNYEKMLSRMISGGAPPKEAFDDLRSMVGDKPAKAALKLYEERVGIIRLLKDPITVRAPGATSWYAGPHESDKCWPALQKYLLEKKKWNPDTVESIDTATTKILSLMQHPGYGRFKTKGLVVGYVQSGKTANYTGLIAKAADVGYRLIIVLAGIHNSLRSQTQKRLGKELIELNDKQWLSPTSIDKDFTPSAGGNTNALLTEGSHLRILCVVKKNYYVLKRLLKWVDGGDPSVLASCPTLIIDDEADQAGLNASRDENVRTAINKQILKLLDSLPKVAYVGYTATPFANVLIDPKGDDLYPSSFIVSLPKPAGYFGAETLFGRERLREDDDSFESDGLDMIRLVDAKEVLNLRPQGAKDRETFTPKVTASLEAALQYFILSCAARRVRGQQGHCSMLVHTTLYASSHWLICEKVENWWKKTRRAVKKEDEKVLKRLEERWEAEVDKVDPARFGCPRHDFTELKPHLLSVMEEAHLLVENGESLDRLNYTEGDRIQIAIGGNTLSRGLTLEGLLVSLFVRSASAYDTLLQMGRWFGYRFGYQDLPRIWMTAELRKSFRMLATVEHEIRNDISRYDTDNMTPEEFGVRVRTHPGMTVTSRLKMAHSVECDISFAGTTTQTRIFKHTDEQWLDSNLAATRTLLSKLGNPEIVGHQRVYRGAPVEAVLEFLEAYAFHEDQPSVQSAPICEYIRQENNLGGLTNWSIAVVQRREASPELETLLLAPNVDVNLVNRSRQLVGTTGGANLGTITSQTFWNLDVSEKRRKDARNEQIRRTPSDPPLLVIIPISRHSIPKKTKKKTKKPVESEPLNAVEHVIGLGISFPETKHSSGKNYVRVNLKRIKEPYRDQEELVEDQEADGGEGAIAT